MGTGRAVAGRRSHAAQARVGGHALDPLSRRHRVQVVQHGGSRDVRYAVVAGQAAADAHAGRDIKSKVDGLLKDGMWYESNV